MGALRDRDPRRVPGGAGQVTPAIRWAVVFRLPGTEPLGSLFDVAEEPELHVVRLPDVLGPEHRARIARERQEARRRYVEYLASVLAVRGVVGDIKELADAVLDALVVWTDVTTGERCRCSCHPRLPESDLHDYGFACVCGHTAEEWRRHWAEWKGGVDEFWASPEGRRVAAARRAEEDELAVWLADNPDVDVGKHGGLAPEQWWGEVDGHSFYFRERHDHWRIELDLRPSGRFSRVWVGGDLDDDASFEPREIEEGEVVAVGTTADEGYGTTPVERIRFITTTIRTKLGREACDVHLSERADLELLFGRPLAWCPACGVRLS
jgi:hypothetical protein